MIAQETQGSLTVEGDEDEVTITSTSADFQEALDLVKRGLIVQAQQVRRQAALQNNGAVAFQRRAEEAETEEQRTEDLAEAERRERRRDQLLDQAADLEARAQGTLGAEEIGSAERSLLVNVAGGWVRLTEVDANTAKGEVLSPLTGAVSGSADWTLYQLSLIHI